jgi:hypothetical protein
MGPFYSDVVHPRVADGDRLQIYFIITLQEQKRGGPPERKLGKGLSSTYYEEKYYEKLHKVWD